MFVRLARQLEARAFAVAAAAAWTALAGCQSGPYGSQAQVQRIQQDNIALSEENRTLRQRNAALDLDNQEQAKLFAQSQQQLRDRDATLQAMRQQLKDVSNRLVAMQNEKREADQKVEALTASTRRSGGAAIRANSTLSADLPSFKTPDVRARADGEVIRVSIPADKLFRPGTTQWSDDAAAVLAEVGNELKKRYPRHPIAVEGHADSDASRGAAWENLHVLTAQQAAAVFDQLVTTGVLPASQLFIVGHGSNHPAYSNAEAKGRELNRRIELVVYPEERRP